jgi:hypothetical protein
MTAAPAEAPEARPPSYATADAARAYVSAILAAAPSAPAGPVYVATHPGPRKRRRALQARLADVLPGADLAGWLDLPAETLAALAAPAAPGTRPAMRSAYLAATHPGLVVVAVKVGGSRVVGPGILAEVAAFTAQARPVLVFTGRRLVAWVDCRVRPVPAPTSAVAAWLDVPAETPAVLPTVAASCRALGLGLPVDPPRRPMLAGRQTHTRPRP